jgi:TfoX/Sxy family transcriptional regulator of competence genes
MASDQSFVEFICEQAGLGAALSYKRMFGEYALYLQGKVVAFVCDNRLLIKPTEPGRELLGSVTEAKVHPRSKLYFLIDQELDDRELLPRLLRTTADALPPRWLVACRCVRCHGPAASG